MTDDTEATPCVCKCGYSCGRQCGLPIMECMEKHYTRDCEHDFTGPLQEVAMGGNVHARSKLCSKCGTSAIHHDMRVGP